MHDAVELQRRGISAIVIVSAPFVEFAKQAAADLGSAEISVVVVDHPLTNVSLEVVRERGRAAYREIFRRLSPTMTYEEEGEARSG